MFGCTFGHDSYIVSTETLIKSPYYGFTFWRCHRCTKCKIDGESFKGTKRGKWKDNWTDDGGIMPKKSLPDKKCPKCDRRMEKTTAFGGSWSCEPDMRMMGFHNADKIHFERIKATPEDYDLTV